jgi:hypothetical protein
MTATEILNRVQNHKGQILPVVINSTVKTLKAFRGVNIVKRTHMFVTAGTEFANRKDVRDAIDAGLRGEVQPLPWGSWVQYPFIIGHTPKSTGMFTEYVRLYPPTEAQLAHFNLSCKVEFFMDGQQIDRETAIQYCGAEAKENEVKSECFSVAVNNVII